LPDDLKHLGQLLLDMKDSLEREMREGFERISTLQREMREGFDRIENATMLDPYVSFARCCSPLATRHSSRPYWPPATGH
jgi:hypothetical protein